MGGLTETDNEASQRKESAIDKIISKRKYNSRAVFINTVSLHLCLQDESCVGTCISIVLCDTKPCSSYYSH